MWQVWKIQRSWNLYCRSVLSGSNWLTLGKFTVWFTHQWNKESVKLYLYYYKSNMEEWQKMQTVKKDLKSHSYPYFLLLEWALSPISQINPLGILSLKYYATFMQIHICNDLKMNEILLHILFIPHFIYIKIYVMGWTVASKFMCWNPDS